MNSRERVKKVLNRELPDRLPFNFWMDRDLMKKLDEKYGENFRVNHYGVDVIESFFQAEWFPELKREFIMDETTSWQVKPLKESILEAEKLNMPDAEDERIYQLLKSDRKKYPDKAIFALITTPLDILLSLRLFEGMFLDFYDYPEEVEKFLYRAGNILAGMSRKACALDIDVLYVAGDICSAQGPLMSRDLLVRFGFEPIKGIVDEAKKAGVPVFYHTDGAVMDILDLFIQYGFDGINPLQPHLNDIGIFKKCYGDKLLLYGGLDNCFKIPDGSVEDVINHVEETFEILGKDGGLIASSHDIPKYVPLENVDAMVDTIKGCVY